MESGPWWLLAISLLRIPTTCPGLLGQMPTSITNPWAMPGGASGPEKAGAPQGETALPWLQLGSDRVLDTFFQMSELAVSPAKGGREDWL